MRLLLDTHVLLWHILGLPDLKPAARALVIDPDHEVYVSAASVWEVAIKQGAGKLKVPEDFVEQIERHELEILPILAEHGWRAGLLPPHHRDPFDRMLVAQAQLDDLTVLTRDRKLAAYDVATHPA